ncbi:MAG: nucleoside triphosphate pyrophosphohydrolase [Candidatus Buchananbacteria bacterium]
MEKIYKKLVRDKIPRICEKTGETPKYFVLSQNRFKAELKNKLLEEANELAKARPDEIKNEIADVYEVLLNLAKTAKIPWSQVEKFRIIKNQKRGSFKKRYFLVSTKK